MPPGFEDITGGAGDMADSDVAVPETDTEPTTHLRAGAPPELPHPTGLRSRVRTPPPPVELPHLVAPGPEGALSPPEREGLVGLRLLDKAISGAYELTGGIAGLSAPIFTIFREVGSHWLTVGTESLYVCDSLARQCALPFF